MPCGYCALPYRATECEFFWRSTELGGVERTETQKVLDGDLDEFVEARLKSGIEAGAKRLD